MKMSFGNEIDDEETFLEMEMEKFSDLSYTEGFYWPNKEEENAVNKITSLPSIKTFLPTTSKENKNESFGHLSCREYIESISYDDSNSENLYDDNYIILTLDEACQNEPSKFCKEFSNSDEICDSPENKVEELLECRWEDCWKLYKSQKELVSHIEKVHVEQQRGRDEFPCLWASCPRTPRPFNARYKLLIHMRVHSGEKPNKCEHAGCFKAFSRLENLKIHQRSHTGERPYLCTFSQCNKAFSNSSDRAKHQRTHFDTRPYACQVKGCRKRYTDPSSLRKHSRNHGTFVQPKKLIASEPIVSAEELKSRTRINSDSSDSYSTTEFYNLHSDDTSLFDCDDSLDSDVEREFLAVSNIESSSFLSLKEEDIIRTFS